MENTPSLLPSRTPTINWLQGIPLIVQKKSTFHHSKHTIKKI